MPRKRYAHTALTFTAWDTVVRELLEMRDADIEDTATRTNLDTVIAQLRYFWADYRKELSK